MKQLFSILTFLVFILFYFSCKKDKQDMELSPAFYTPCTKVLDDWKINVYPLPEVQRQNDVFFINEETGFTVGNAGTILKTTNGGKDWVFQEKYYDLTTHQIVQDALTDSRLLTVFFTDEAVGYVGGNAEDIPISGGNLDAVLLKTTDGGDTWSKQYLPGIRYISDLYFTDANNGLGLFTPYEGDEVKPKRLFSTHDGGVNWEPMLSPNLIVRSPVVEIRPDGLGLWVENLGELQSSYLHSTDQGATWQARTLPSTDCARVNYAMGEPSFANCGGNMYLSHDDGSNWEIMPDNIMVEAFLSYFTTALKGFAIVPAFDYVSGGGETTAILSSFEVYQTTNGGKTWDKTLIDKECDFTGTAFSLSDDVFYTVGWNAVNKFELK